MGERTHAQKCAKLLGVEKIVDIPTHIGERYEELVMINSALAEGGYSPISPQSTQNEWSLSLTWSAGLAALLAKGIKPNITKLYVHQKDEKILKLLYKEIDLLITESLLGNERAAAYGLERVLYLPHHFTKRPKPLKKKSKKILIGCVCRLEYWKNVEFALEMGREVAKHHPIAFYLKGDFPKERVYSSYDKHLAEKLAIYEKEPWLIWDRSYTPYPEVLKLYSSFDFCVQPSGAEGGSNVVVELMSLGKPVIVLDESTNPYLFKGGALFAKPNPSIVKTQLAFYQPQLQSLIELALRLCDEKERKLWSQRAEQIAFERFHPSIAKRRLAVMLDPKLDNSTLKKLYDQDRTLYRL
ncbi:MAG: hypothetical protein S4CHLAM45_06450 [Chlamydiales bacterium]|nr:hypothetical protein [Chlamydiales bacterium]MCH9619815.1 hypothetical protein [Chlamydiales bacterium]MCH9622758.1 hypothetical protein [Chlamydiales bacterium]